MEAARYCPGMRWDVFVSHASEDKAAVAEPLTEALKLRGLRVWLDRQELRLGDSLREKIDRGLAESRFGVVVISPAFLGKRWPSWELNGLVAIESGGRKAVLPVWHGIDHATLVSHSPMLADRVAADTADGIDHVADAITSAVLAEPDGAAPTVAQLLLRVLESDDPRRTGEFLAAHPSVLQGALGSSWRVIRRGVDIAGTTIDLCVGSFQPTPSTWAWQGIALAPVSRGPVDDSGAVVPLIRGLAARRPGPLLRKPLPDFRARDFRVTVVAGRRRALTRVQADAVAEFNDRHSGLRVRSYDWLIDAAAALP